MPRPGRPNGIANFREAILDRLLSRPAKRCVGQRHASRPGSCNAWQYGCSAALAISALCGDSCSRLPPGGVFAGDRRGQLLVEATQASQNAQSGYAADYGSKRPLLALHEIAEWMRGQRQLASDLPEATPAYLGSRHVRRFMSDAYGRGTVRTGVEVTNLLTRGRAFDVTAAETLKTSPTEAFPGQAYVRCLERHHGIVDDKRPERRQVVLDERNKRRRVLTTKDVDVFYGYRGDHPAVRHLSPFEFHRYWKVELARYAAVGEALRLRLENELKASGHLLWVRQMSS